MHQKKLKTGIIGTGKVGTDLLFKVARSPFLECTMFVGRSNTSAGLKVARELGVATSAESFDVFRNNPDLCDLIFDATSATDHERHAPEIEALGVRAIDLTPANVGEFCIPALNRDQIAWSNNINMVTCGGQSSVPILACLADCYDHIKKVEVVSRVAESSIGPATLENIDKYYSSTAEAINRFSGIEIKNVSIDLQLEKSRWKPDMLTIISAKINEKDLDRLYQPLEKRLEAIRKYVPGYNIVGTPSRKRSMLTIMVSVRGMGDWMPSYAGNLDIINCAALTSAEYYASTRLSLPDPFLFPTAIPAKNGSAVGVSAA